MKRLLILLLTGLFAQLVVSCYPEGADNIEDYDVAITNYDKGADFSAFTTFSIPDTVVYFANDNSAGKPSHEFDDAVIKAVTDNFVAMGYEKVADPTATTPAEDLPSFIVTVSAFSNVNYAYFVDNWYNNWNWYWGGWWGGPFNPYYPWYPVSVYSYRDGSSRYAITMPESEQRSPARLTGRHSTSSGTGSPRHPCPARRPTTSRCPTTRCAV